MDFDLEYHSKDKIKELKKKISFLKKSYESMNLVNIFISILFLSLQGDL